MSDANNFVHPSLQDLGDHLGGLAAIKAEQQKTRMAFEAEQKRLETERLAQEKSDEIARLAQQQKEPLRDLRTKFPRLFEACPQLMPEIDDMLASSDVSRDWAHVVKERAKTCKEMAVALDAHESWIQTDKAGAGSGLFDTHQWHVVLSSVTFDKPGRMSAQFKKLQDAAVSVFKQKAKEERDRKTAEEETQQAAQRAIDDAASELAAIKSRVESRQTRRAEYESAVASVRNLGIRELFWKLFVVINAVAMTVPLIWIVSDYAANGSLLLWVCTLPMAFLLHFLRRYAPLGELKPTPSAEILAWFICLFLMLFARKGNWLLGIFGVFMEAFCVVLIWDLISTNNRTRRRDIEMVFSDVANPPSRRLTAQIRKG